MKKQLDLIDEVVIRSLYNSYQYTQKQLAKIFNVSLYTIKLILNTKDNL